MTRCFVLQRLRERLVELVTDKMESFHGEKECVDQVLEKAYRKCLWKIMRAKGNDKDL